MVFYSRTRTSSHSEGRSNDGFDLYAEARAPRASTPSIPRRIALGMTF